jgi:hypothetical protein
MCTYSCDSVEQLIVKHVISLATSSKSGIKYKLKSVQENVDIISKVDAVTAIEVDFVMMFIHHSWSHLSTVLLCLKGIYYLKIFINQYSVNMVFSCLLHAFALILVAVVKNWGGGLQSSNIERM